MQVLQASRQKQGCKLYLRLCSEVMHFKKQYANLSDAPINVLSEINQILLLCDECAGRNNQRDTVID